MTVGNSDIADVSLVIGVLAVALVLAVWRIQVLKDRIYRLKMELPETDTDNERDDR